MSLTKDQLRDITKSMNEALQAVAQKHGLTSLATNGGTFDPSGNFVIKVAGVISGGVSREEKYYKDVQDAFDLPPLGTTFKSNSGINKICGMTSRGSKIIAEREGKKFLWPVDQVQKLIKKRK